MRARTLAVLSTLAVTLPFAAPSSALADDVPATATTTTTTPTTTPTTTTSATGDSSLSATEKTTPAGPAERFGLKGQFAFSSDAALTLQSASTSGVSGSTMTVSLHPAFDYFVVGNVSIGGFVGLDYSKTGDDHSTRASIGPRAGYNLVLSDLASIWPKFGFSFSSTSTTLASTTGPTSVGTVTASETNLALNVFVPLIFHPMKHFFAGFGPFIDTDLTGDKKTTVFGGKLTLGGWI